MAIHRVRRPDLKQISSWFLGTFGAACDKLSQHGRARDCRCDSPNRGLSHFARDHRPMPPLWDA